VDKCIVIGCICSRIITQWTFCLFWGCTHCSCTFLWEISWM